MSQKFGNPGNFRAKEKVLSNDRWFFLFKSQYFFENCAIIADFWPIFFIFCRLIRINMTSNWQFFWWNRHFLENMLFFIKILIIFSPQQCFYPKTGFQRWWIHLSRYQWMVNIVFWWCNFGVFMVVGSFSGT